MAIRLNNNENDPENSEEPSDIIEYLFIEKGYDLQTIPKHNQGSFYGCIELSFPPSSKIDLSILKKLIPKDISSSASELIYFQGKKIDLNEYQFGVLDESKNIKVFEAINESFLKKLESSMKFLVFGKEFDLGKLREHKIFNDFYKYVYSLNDDLEQEALNKYIEPDATIEYLFVEKAENQVKPINDDQSYLMAFINIFYTGDFKNNTLNKFKSMLLDELNYSIRNSKYFKNKEVNLDDYKFYLVDNDMNYMEFISMDEVFFKTLIELSLRNLVIVGKNFNLDKFKHHDIFLEWFNKYTNKF